MSIILGNNRGPGHKIVTEKSWGTSKRIQWSVWEHSSIYPLRCRRMECHMVGQTLHIEHYHCLVCESSLIHTGSGSDLILWLPRHEHHGRLRPLQYIREWTW